MKGLAEAVARYYFKPMAYKDEYEVAGSTPRPISQLENTFEGDYKVKFNLAPPLFAKKDPETGHLRKKEYGPWVFFVFKLLAEMRFLRSTPFDPFGYTRAGRSGAISPSHTTAACRQNLPCKSLSAISDVGYGSGRTGTGNEPGRYILGPADASDAAHP